MQVTRSTGQNRYETVPPYLKQYRHLTSQFELSPGAYVCIEASRNTGFVVRSRRLGVNRFLAVILLCDPVPALHPVYTF